MINKDKKYSKFGKYSINGKDSFNGWIIHNSPKSKKEFKPTISISISKI